MRIVDGLQEFPQFIQERFLSEGVELQKHRLASSGSDGREMDFVRSVLKQGHAETEPVIARKAVSLEHPDTATGASAAEIA